MTLLDPDSLGETWASPDPGGWENSSPTTLMGRQSTSWGVAAGVFVAVSRYTGSLTPQPSGAFDFVLNFRKGGHFSSPQSVCTCTPYTHHSHVHTLIHTSMHVYSHLHIQSHTHVCTHSHRLTPRSRVFLIKTVTLKTPNTCIYSRLMAPFSHFASQSARAMPSEASPSGPS